jgi:methyl-accepting chemotaxis protein
VRIYEEYKHKHKTNTLVISSILIVSIIILVQTSLVLKDTAKIFTDNFEKEAYKTKEEELKNYIQIALNTVEFFYNKTKENPLKTEQYKKDALEAIKGIKFGSNGYFWINNSTPTMIMHPTIKNLNNQNLSKIKDSNGVYFFNKMVNLTANNNSGGNS